MGLAVAAGLPTEGVSRVDSVVLGLGQNLTCFAFVVAGEAAEGLVVVLGLLGGGGGLLAGGNLGRPLGGALSLAWRKREGIRAYWGQWRGRCRLPGRCAWR